MKQCTIKDCNKEVLAKGLCSMHYYRLITNGNPNITKRRPNGDGQIFRGYKLVTVDGKQVREHRVIIEKYLGRKLKPFPIEVVHHINGNGLDNRIDNLKVLSQSEHTSSHLRKHFVKNGSKVCSKCNKLTPVSEFHKQKACIDGLKSWCKSCEKALVKSHQ